MSKSLDIAVLKEWDDRLDSMEILFDACIELGDPYEKQLKAARKLRRLIRDIIPFDNQPIVEKVSNDDDIRDIIPFVKVSNDGEAKE